MEVTVVRVNGNKKDTACQHTFQPKELKDYPGSDKAITQKITIPNVNDKKEKLEIYYKLMYNTNGSILNFLNTEHNWQRPTNTQIGYKDLIRQYGANVRWRI